MPDKQLPTPRVSPKSSKHESRTTPSCQKLINSPNLTEHTVTNEKYYAESGELQEQEEVHHYKNHPMEGSQRTLDSCEVIKMITMKHSKHLPNWLWSLISTVFGVHKPLDDPSEQRLFLFAKFMRYLTIVSALSFLIFHVIYTAFALKQSDSKTALLSGCVSSCIVFICAFFGIYSNRLGLKLFRHEVFRTFIRLHCKTVVKINTALLTVLLIALFSAVNIWNARWLFYDETCNKLDVSIYLCKGLFISRLFHTVLTTIWVSIVAVVLLSVCRTHVIGIRRYIRDLDTDSLIYVQYFTNLYENVVINEPCEAYNRLWLPSESDTDEDEKFSDTDEQELSSNRTLVNGLNRRLTQSCRLLSAPSFYGNRMAGSFGMLYGFGDGNNEVSPLVDNDWRQASSGAILRHNMRLFRNQSNFANNRQSTLISTKQSSVQIEDETLSTIYEVGQTTGIKMKEDDQDRKLNQSMDYNVDHSKACNPENPNQNQQTSKEKQPLAIGMFTNAEILHRNWRIYSRLRLTAGAFQRWLFTIFCLSVFWITMYLVYWVNHEPYISEIAQFIAPCLLLPTLGSAYAEVNNEGGRVTRCICPIEDRLWMLNYLLQAPLQIGVFGVIVRHVTLSTTLFGVVFGLATGILMLEIKRFI